jgi:hypothetical protein
VGAFPEDHFEEASMTGNAKMGYAAYDPNWYRKVSWWPVAITPVATIAAVVLSRFWPKWFQGLQVLLDDPLGPCLVALAAAIYTVRAVRTFNPLYIIVAALGIALTWREIHRAWAHEGIYVALGVVGIWTVLWHKRLLEPLRDYRHTSWLIAMFTAYFFSQLIARRAFKAIPGEHEIHRSLEECAETAAHVVFIVAALVGNWKRYRRGAPDQPEPNEAGE